MPSNLTFGIFKFNTNFQVYYIYEINFALPLFCTLVTPGEGNQSGDEILFDVRLFYSSY